MKNEIYHITKNELNSIKQQLRSQRGLWVSEIDGSKIPTWRDYAHEIEKTFRFPTPCDRSIDVYLDWIRDLEWLNADGYALIIYNSENFIKDEPERRELIMETFEEYVLPWWQEEVERCVVGGRAKPFNIYLVD